MINLDHTIFRRSDLIRLSLLVLLLTTICRTAVAQPDRMAVIDQRLRDLAVISPGLNEKVTLSVSGASLQEFLRGLAEASGININVATNLDMRIYNNFQGETPINILRFLATEYDLDYTFTGSIISVHPVDPANIRRPARPIEASYDPQSGLVNLSLEQDSLIVVARHLTQLTGTNIIVTNELQGKLVSIFLQQQELGAALRQLAFNNQLKLSSTSGGTYVYLPLGPNEENYINSEAEMATRRVPIQTVQPEGGNQQFFLDALEQPGSGGKLLTIEAQDTPIDQIIKNAANQVEANYFLFSGLQGTATTKLRNVSFDQLLTSLLRGTPYTYKLNNGIYLIGERRLEGLREIKAVRLQHRSIDTVQTMIPAEWKQGVEVKEFREQNTLLLAGASPQVEEITELIRELDVLVPMVLIEVHMLDMRKGHDVSTGISAGVSDSVQTGGTILSGLDYTFGARSINSFLARIGSGAFNLGRVSPNFYIRLSALESNRNIEMRSVPKLSTLNGHAATLSIGNSRYYSLSTQSQLGTLTPQNIITQQFQQVEANTTIKIKPIVSGDEQVTLNISVDISDFTQDTPLDQPPPTSTSKFESIIRIRNEETVVLGGIERFESSDVGSGVPLLSRIPILKWFFSSKTKSRNKIVSVVFIKPTIIYQ